MIRDVLPTAAATSSTLSIARSTSGSCSFEQDLVFLGHGNRTKFQNDRMGTPVRLTNEAGATVWRADYRPFGDVQRLETDVDGDGVHVEQPLRFPGQYDDAMSALILAQGPYYNLNRDYEPATGRYLSPEPMLQDPAYIRHLAESGYVSPTYAYAFNNPLRWTDPTGLQVPLDLPPLDDDMSNDMRRPANQCETQCYSEADSREVRCRAQGNGNSPCYKAWKKERADCRALCKDAPRQPLRQKDAGVCR